MDTQMLAGWRRHERMFFAGMTVVFLLFLFPALRDARRDARDDVRIANLTRIKQRLEQYFNAYENFPQTSLAEPRSCSFSDDTTRESLWENANHLLNNPSLPREQRRSWFPYVYCPTAFSSAERDGGVTGFFLQTALEHPRLFGSGFDREQGRNYRYRVIVDGSWTFYRICGGTDLSCGRATASSPWEDL